MVSPSRTFNMVSAERLPNLNCVIGGDCCSRTVSPSRITSIFIFNESSFARWIFGSTVSFTPVSRNSIDVTVEVVGTAPVAACPGSTLVVESKIGCLSPIFTSAFLLLRTRTFGAARVLASVTCLKKSSCTFVGSLNR